MDRIRLLALGLGVLGLGVSAYLTAQSFDDRIPLSCPSTGVIDCGKVITSTYSHIMGVPVALLGALWFVAILILVYFDLKSVLLPFWTLGLVFTEVFLIHSICVYCTAVHVTVVALGYPAAKLSLSGE